MNEEQLKNRVAELEKTLKNIVAVADGQSSVAARFNRMRHIAETAILPVDTIAEPIRKG